MRRSKTRRSLRRWPRRTLISVNIVVALLVVAAGVVYGYARYQLDSIHTGSAKGLSKSDGVDSAEDGYGLEPENILLIGNETRAGQTEVNAGNPAELSGSLSDVIMILHLNPKKGTASILSIPRDVFTPMPAGSEVGPYQKIDAALNDGALGPNNLAAAITEDFGIPINHYVEVDFDGFLNTVNALGGIKMDFPERLYDAYSDLDIGRTGCQLIHGSEALALVRSRHLQYDPPGVDPYDPSIWPYDPESDLARIVRDHTFIRVLIKTAESEGLTNPIKANNFISSLIDQITIDPGLKSQLIRLVERYHDLDAGSLPTTTIPVTQVSGYDEDGYEYAGYNYGDVEFPTEPADMDTIRAWDPGAFPTPVDPAKVEVYNIAGASLLATDTASELGADGFHVTLAADGAVPADPSETVVQYHPGQLAEGFAVFEKLRGAVILQSSSSVPAGTVEVQAGTTFAVDLTSAAKPTASSTTPSSTSQATTSPSSTKPPSATTTTTTTVPTPDGQVASSASDQLTPYDPRPC